LTYVVHQKVEAALLQRCPYYRDDQRLVHVGRIIPESHESAFRFRLQKGAPVRKKRFTSALIINNN
jgi:hypothetical protein